MDGPLLATKLHPPARRETSVLRTRLTDRLAKPGRLVLVAAPAGFGKTSILTEWLTQIDAPSVAWLSLDNRDNDATQFWRYAFAALDQVEPGVASGAIELLDSSSASHEAVLGTLVNDLHSRGTEVLLVLDDYHVIDNPSVHAGVTFLVDNLPASVHLVIASRTDPPLPLARLRARGELTELRAADLRFTPDEASEYLNDAMGLAVGAADVARLDARTEGWIAALQLAALSMQGRGDTSEFIAGFAGDDRYVVDYLVEEVLQKQPDATRTFLLQTSILSRLCGDLCDAVAQVTDSAARLESLDRANLFLVPLDHQREWYRYHHLFAEMLRARLLDEQPEAVADLHLRASEWFELHGDMAEAIGHAIDARSFDRAARLIKEAAPGMQQRRQELTLVGWFDLLPDELVRSDPELGLRYAGVLLSAGRTDGVDRLLQNAEMETEGTSEGLLTLRRGVALYRAARALTSGDAEAALAHSGVALELSKDGSHIDRGSANGIRGLIQWAMGDLESARTTWAISLRELQDAGHLADVLGGSIAVGDILTAQGRLSDAEATYSHGLDLAATTNPPLRGAADMHVGMTEVLRERGDLDGARHHLTTAEALGEYAGLPQNRHRRRMAAARLLAAEGDAAAGIPLLEEAEALYTPDFFPEVRPIAALRARLQLAAGRNADALTLMRRRRVSVDDELSYVREFDHITLARVLLATAKGSRDVSAVLALLNRLLEAAEAGGRLAATIEVLVLRSLASQRAGRTDDALSALERAIALAEPEGFVRVFADEGQPMAQLLAALTKRVGDNNPYLRRLRAAVGSGTHPTKQASGALIDPLSQRELEVLRLLASELSGPEISRHLVVSLNTVRTHTKNIYAKLGATTRREAVKRASELGLLNSPG